MKRPLLILFVLLSYFSFGQKEIEVFKGDKQPVGQFSLAKPFSTHEITITKGDAIYLFTDGYMDQFGGEKQKKYKSSRFKELFEGLNNKTCDQMSMELEAEFMRWKGDLEQLDDLCIIGIRI